MSARFDTLTYAKKLQAAGFSPAQAEAQAEALRAVVDDNLATKRDLKDLDASLRHEIQALDGALRLEIKEMESRLRHEMAAIENRLTMRPGGLIVGATGVLAVLIKLL